MQPLTVINKTSKTYNFEIHLNFFQNMNFWGFWYQQTSRKMWKVMYKSDLLINLI